MNKQKQETMNIESWVLPKEVQIVELKQAIEVQELNLKQIKENIKSGFYIKKLNKEIKEQIPHISKKLKELELERLERDINAGFFIKQSELILENIKSNLATEEKTLKGIKRKITMANRNHKIKNGDVSYV